MRGRGVEGAVCTELGRGLARLPTANAGAAADEREFVLLMATRYDCREKCCKKQTAPVLVQGVAGLAT